MEPEIAFGDCLREVLDEKNDCLPKRRWTASALAAEINVDASLVRRWLRGDRVPALDSEHLRRITEVLDLSADEYQRLEAAQVYSLKLGAPGKGQPPEPQFLQLVRRAEPAVHAPSAGRAVADEPLKTLPPRGGGIQTQEKTLAAAIQLLESAARFQPPRPSSILLTFQGARDPFEGSRHKERWQRAVRAVLQQGWDVCHIWRLERDVHRCLSLVENMLAYLDTTGTYEPRYVTRYGVSSPPHDLLIVPGLGAMILFATTQPQQIDAAIYSPDPAQIELLSGHFRQLHDQTRVLLSSYSDRKTLREAVYQVEEMPGGRFLVKDALSELTRPLSFYESRAQWPSPEPTHGAAQHRRRLEAFAAHVQTSSYRDVCPKSAVERLVMRGKYGPDEREIPGNYEASPLERLEHLENAVTLLRRHANYSIALLDQQEEAELLRTFWAVQGDHTVLLETWRPDEQQGEARVDLIISEPTIAGAFQAYADELWEKISPRNRDKEYVTCWLQEQVELLRRSPARLR